MSAGGHRYIERQFHASQLVGELEWCWETIARTHPGLPDTVIVLGAGELRQGRGLRLGRFSPCRWTVSGQDLGEVFIGSEGRLDDDQAAKARGMRAYEAYRASGRMKNGRWVRSPTEPMAGAKHPAQRGEPLRSPLAGCRARARG